MHKKSIKLTERKIEPVLLVQTRVPGGWGKSQNKGKGIGRANMKTWKENANQHSLSWSEKIAQTWLKPKSDQLTKSCPDKQA